MSTLEPSGGGDKFNKLSDALVKFEAYSKVQGSGHSFLKVDKSLNFSLTGDKRGAASIKDAAKAVLELAKELSSEKTLTISQVNSLKNRISILKQQFHSSELRSSDKPDHFFESAIAQVETVSVATLPQANDVKMQLKVLERPKENITDKMLQVIQEKDEESEDESGSPLNTSDGAKAAAKQSVSVDTMLAKIQEQNSRELVSELKENITEACKGLSPEKLTAVQNRFDKTAQEKLSVLIKQYEDDEIPHRYEAFQLALIESFEDIIKDLVRPRDKAVEALKVFKEISTEPKSKAYIDAFLELSVDDVPAKKAKKQAQINPETAGGEHDYMYKDEQGPWRADYPTELSIRDLNKGKVEPKTFAEILSSSEEIKEGQFLSVAISMLQQEVGSGTGTAMIKVLGKQGISGVLNQVLDDIETEKISAEEAPQKVREYINAIFMSVVEKEGDAAGGRKQLANVKLEQAVMNKLDQALEKIVSDPTFQQVLSRYIDENLDV